MEKVRITKLEPLSKDERGGTYEIFGRPTSDFLLAFRKQGSVSGNHWHEGKSRGKNPEVFILISGKVELDTRDLESGEEATAIITAPAQVEIEKQVFHTLRALSDCAFLEFNSLEEHKADTRYP